MNSTETRAMILELLPFGAEEGAEALVIALLNANTPEAEIDALFECQAYLQEQEDKQEAWL